MTRTGVQTDLETYRIASAELPRTAFRSASAHRAVVVVDGRDDWPTRARNAVDAGAVGVVVADPGPRTVDVLDDLVDGLRGTPVVLDRAFLRPDTVREARESLAQEPRAILFDGTSDPLSVEVLRRDAAGWLRALCSDSTLVLHPGMDEEQPAAVRSDWFVFQTVTGTEIVAGSQIVHNASGASPSLGVSTLGEARLDLTLTRDEPPRVSVTDAAGRRSLRTPFESRQRLALRRAVRAVATGDHPRDLDELVADARLL